MTKQLRAEIFLLIVTAIWGASFPLMKGIQQDISTFSYLTLRFVIATAALVLVFWSRLRQMNRQILRNGAIIGVMLFGGMGLQVLGLQYTTASNSAFITGLNVVMVPVLSTLLLRKKPGWNATLGVVLAFAGLFFLSGGLRYSFNIGDFLTFLCAICFTLQIVFIDKFTNGQDPILLAIVQIASTAVLSAGAWAVEGAAAICWSPRLVWTLLITGLLGTALGYAAQTFVQRFTSPTRTALIFTAEPVFGAFFAILIPNAMGVTESLTWNAVWGCILILSGMVIAEIKWERRK